MQTSMNIKTQLIDHLKEVFPDKCPDPKEDLSTVMYKAGQASVVRFLEDLKAREEETDVLR